MIHVAMKKGENWMILQLKLKVIPQEQTGVPPCDLVSRLMVLGAAMGNGHWNCLWSSLRVPTKSSILAARSLQKHQHNQYRERGLEPAQQGTRIGYTVTLRKIEA